MLHTDLWLDPALDEDFCLSKSADAVCAPLQAIAAKATTSELMAISLTDFGQDADKHLKRLIEVIEHEGCAISQTDTWYPLEVVQLASHVPSSEGWRVATAIVLVTAVRLNDCWGDAEFRWFRQAEFYRALESPVADALQKAIRHLYQADIDFGLTASFDTVDAGPKRLFLPDTTSADL